MVYVRAELHHLFHPGLAEQELPLAGGQGIQELPRLHHQGDVGRLNAAVSNMPRFGGVLCQCMGL